MDPSQTDLEAEIWEGRIPVVVNLHPNDISTLNSPPGFYMLIPRLVYLPSVSSTIIDHFSDSVPAYGGSNDVWFDFNGVPMNWQLPVGVLFDLYCASSLLPWKLTIHFQSYPLTKLAKGEGENATEQHFYHSLKQALFLEHGSSKLAMSIPRDEQKLMWDSLRNQDPVAFCKLNRRFKSRSPEAIPVRFLRSQDSMMTQVPCKTHDEDGSLITIAAALGSVMPPFSSSSGSPPMDAGCIVCHGTRIPLDAPLVEVWEALCHPDHFLYVSLTQ